MGLLDDAIREHLDLKRRHGADPTEIERAEHEALGPVRRAPATDEPEIPEEAGGDRAIAYDHEGEEAWDEEFEGPADEEGVFDNELEYREPHEHEPTGAGAVEEEWDLESERPAHERDPHATPPEEDSAPPRPRPADTVGQKTEEYDVESEHRHEAARQPGEEDMLEETPEFLQDTPDHDRLWFEQKPPRDFDFDG